ncbi:MarR family transcriptional regulator [Micromonospora echinospora]|uniref:DNA-binding transcriptional regulator, MarR family n=1 Tax=Micromonospora echinospora TaxID=1877 RepID=A0A1C4ZZL6_MICEC|nr:MarR family transcriptional regulator [Micromonospora echinospora]OZV83836.1 MarR family transcriptional regulator [Micromonospora echinospora]SCF38326.1 DNA-binding transcriptional regulator, MarR family [Micromonospora echinospora]
MTTEEPPRQGPLTADEEAFLRAFARTILTVPRALDADLLRDQGMSMSEYTALRLLSEAPDRRLRMNDLAVAGALSLSGMSRIVDRLEEQGLVRRQRCPNDRRGYHAVLTDAGFDRLRQAWPAHLASVRRHVFDHLRTSDLPAFTAALQRFAADVPCPETSHPNRTPTPCPSPPPLPPRPTPRPLRR